MLGQREATAAADELSAAIATALGAALVLAGKKDAPRVKAVVRDLARRANPIVTDDVVRGANG